MYSNGPRPGPHPNPDHDWNKDPKDAKPGEYFDYKGLREYDKNARMGPESDNTDDGY